MKDDFRLTRETLALIRRRIDLGDHDWEISGRIGCDLTTLHNICSRHGYELRDSRSTVPVTVMGLAERTRTAFAREAAARNMTAQQLMSECLDLIAKDRLIEAVLGK